MINTSDVMINATGSCCVWLGKKKKKKTRDDHRSEETKRKSKKTSRGSLDNIPVYNRGCAYKYTGR